ncbi:MAG: hypothetical protein GY756_02460 [bacterium]|nr:hypothetical protein [bacterium]
MSPLLSHSQIIYVKQGAGGGGTSWADAGGDLDAAINGAGVGDEVWVAAGTYYPVGGQAGEFQLKNNVIVYGGFPNVGNPVFGDRNYVANVTILSGDIDFDGLDGGNTYHVIYHNGGGIDNTAILDGFTIEGGYADTENDGGGIYLSNVSPIIRNCNIINNRANDEAGGIYINGGSPQFDNCLIDNNYANDDMGGVRVRNGAAQFTNCTISNNQSRDYYGGLYLRNTTATFTNCDITDNSSLLQSYGGVYIYDNNPTFSGGSINNNTILTAGRDYAGLYIRAGNASFTNVTISGNVSPDFGGGVFIYGGSSTFNTCIIDGNSSEDDGAGVHIRQASTPTFTNCTVSNNTITGNNYGGGFYLRETANPTISSCNINRNTSYGYGGGIYSNSTAWTNAVSSNTISSNTAYNGNARGGGIYLDNSAPDITNNTISNNIASTNTDNNDRGHGGGIYLNGNDLSPTISGNTITGNIARTEGNGLRCGRGGGIYCNQSLPTISNNPNISNNIAQTLGTGAQCGDGGGIYLYLSLLNTIDNNNISNNQAQRYGGGIYMYRSDPNLTSNTIDGNIVNAYQNNTGYGGGICIYDDTGTGTSPTLTSNTISNNQANDNGFATSGYGGGVFMENAVDPNFVTNTINNNSASQRGGGVYFRDGGTNPVFHRNLIHSNTCATGNGGGVYIEGNLSPEFYNNIVRTNNATNGGGFYFTGTDGGTFLNNTVSKNSATDGGGVFYTADSDLRLRNLILWGNTATGSGNNVYINDNNSDPYFTNCCVEGGTAGFAGAGSGGSYPGGRYTNAVELDPQFINAPGNDFHLTLGTSPCIGAGDPGTVAGDFPADEDYDGSIRVRGVVDIGAFETNNPPQFISLPYPPVTDNAGPVAVALSEDEVDALGAPDPFVLTLYAIDLDDDNLTWTISTAATNGTAGITASPTNPPNEHSQIITYTPNADYNGTDQFIVQISDGTLTDLITVDVTINSVNDAPYFVTTPATLNVKSQQTWTYNISTNDIDHALNTLTLTCLAKPAAMTFTPGANGTGTLSWTPADVDVSPPDYTVTLRIQDPAVPPPNNFVDQTFDITVLSRFIYVPADFPTIQQAIDASVNGDKIFVADGTYNENINFNGKEVEIEGDPANPSDVIIDGGGAGPVVTFENGEAGITSLNGFTIQNGSGRTGTPFGTTIHAPVSGKYGAGVFCFQSSPLLKNLYVSGNTLVVSNNHGGSGAGIYIGSSTNVTLEGPNTIIQNNNSNTYRGGGIIIDISDNIILDGTVGNGITIQNNSSGNYGGGIGVYDSSVNISFTDILIQNNQVTGTNGRGGGTYYHNSVITETNVTKAGNSATTAGNNSYTYP